jgi:hypothetical protein
MLLSIDNSVLASAGSMNGFQMLTNKTESALDLLSSLVEVIDTYPRSTVWNLWGLWKTKAQKAVVSNANDIKDKIKQSNEYLNDEEFKGLVDEVFSEKSYKNINKKDDIQRLIDYLTGKQPAPTATPSPSPSPSPTPVPSPTPRPTPTPVPTPIPPTPTPVPVIGIENGYVTYKNSKGDLVTENIADLGKAVEYTDGWNVNSWDGISDLDILARTIFAECTSGLNDYGQEAVAWVIINRLTYKKEEYKSYRGVVLARGQFSTTLGDSDSTKLARNAGTYTTKTRKAAWDKAVNIAVAILTQNTDKISNPIEDRRYFRSVDVFKENSGRYRIVEGQEQLYSDGKWNNIKDVVRYSDNKFFRYGKKD